MEAKKDLKTTEPRLRARPQKVYGPKAKREKVSKVLPGRRNQ